MTNQKILLGLVLAPLLLAACESTHPEPRMGPHSARYITSNYREAFRAALSGMEQTDPIAVASAETEPADAVLPDLELLDVQPAPAPAATAAANRLPPPPQTPRASRAPRDSRPPRSAPLPPPVPAPVAAAAPGAADPAKSAGLPEPLRWAKRDYDKLGSSTPAPPTPQRRFVRLRLTELDGTPVKARDVRPVLRAIVGVQDAVLNETTGTAVVVVDPSMEASTVVKKLEGRYRATIVR